MRLNPAFKRDAAKARRPLTLRSATEPVPVLRFRRTFAFVLLVGFATPAVHAQGESSAGRLAANLVSLTSCSDPERNQYYRVAVFNRGFEHVSSEVYLQWVEWREDGPHLLRSTLVSEVSSGMWSVGQPTVIRGKRCSMQLSATHTYSLESANFVLRPVSLGKYSIQSSTITQHAK